MTPSAARVLTPPLQRFPIGLRAANKLEERYCEIAAQRCAQEVLAL